MPPSSRQGLYTHVVGRRILYYPELKSTMDEAARLADESAEEGTVVIAERQSGRSGAARAQLGFPNPETCFSLYCSVPAMSQLPFISILGGVAAARAVRKTTGLAPKIKWPNDLMLNGRKAAGILAESAIVGDSVCYAVLGIGVNVSLDVSESEEISAVATSVNAAAGREVDRESLLRQLLLELDDLYIRLGRGASPLPEWRGLLETIGQSVTAASGNGTCTGRAEDVDETGNLLLRLEDGRRITLTAGDVTIGGAGQN